MFGRASSAAWMLATSVAAVELHVIGFVVRPLNVRVNVPPLMPPPNVSVWTALAPLGDDRIPVAGAAVRVVALLTITPAICARVPLPLTVRVPPWMFAVPVLAARPDTTRLPAPPLIKEPPPVMFPLRVRGKAELNELIVLGKPLSRPALVGVAAAGIRIEVPAVSGPEYRRVAAAPPVIW